MFVDDQGASVAGVWEERQHGVHNKFIEVGRGVCNIEFIFNTMRNGSNRAGGLVKQGRDKI